MYHLNQYPVEISKVETQILELNRQVSIYKECLFFMDAEIEIAIASNREPKNDQQRKADRIRLKQTPDYLQAKSSLTERDEEHSKAVIRLNLLKNQFSVAKLEMREAIAKLEAVA